jgi:hypothetical protein
MLAYIGKVLWNWYVWARHRLKEDIFFGNFAYRVHLLQQQAILETPPSKSYTESLLSPTCVLKDTDRGEKEADPESVKDEDEEEDWEAALEAELARSDKDVAEIVYEAPPMDDETSA